MSGSKTPNRPDGAHLSARARSALVTRRIGKTVLLSQLRETVGDNGFRAIVLDV